MKIEIRLGEIVLSTSARHIIIIIVTFNTYARMHGGEDKNKNSPIPRWDPDQRILSAGSDSAVVLPSSLLQI